MRGRAKSPTGERHKGDGENKKAVEHADSGRERAKGFEPSIFSLGRRHVTATPRPRDFDYMPPNSYVNKLSHPPS